ncbi:MAG: Thioredoxin [Bacteroidota bacterium]|jgi:thiol-disulfide isomerase/thioredoxin
MNIKTKSIIFVSLSFVFLNCSSQKIAKENVSLDPYYLTQYEDMNNVNTKNSLITTVVRDSSNREFKINELSENHISVIKLWATWCIPCIKSMPEFERIKNQYEMNQKLRFYTVSIDYEYEDWKKSINKREWKVEHYWAGFNQKSQIYHLTYEIFENMVLSTLPNYIIIDESGKLKENLITDENVDKNLEFILSDLSK